MTAIQTHRAIYKTSVIIRSRSS